MTYPEVLNFLFGSLPMYQRIGAAAYKSDLTTTLELDKYFGHPHKKYLTIHVAGTNGKGSVSHMLASVLAEGGLQVGLYTSPHLLDFRERIRINGEMIPEAEVLDFIVSHKNIIEKLEPSFFEMTAAMAFQYFYDREVDIAVIETGMGGKLDSTNIISPIISVITNISFDHTRFLGNSIPDIAREKAGIIKPEVPVVIGEYQPDTEEVFLSKAKESLSDIHFADKHYKIVTSTASGDEIIKSFDIMKDGKPWLEGLVQDLKGKYQLKNIITASAVLDRVSARLGLDKQSIHKGLSSVKTNTGLLGRWQIISGKPLTICDTAHNLAGLREITGHLSTLEYSRLHLVLGLVNDKDINELLSLFPKEAQYYFTQATVPRSTDKEELLEKGSQLGLSCLAYPDVPSAYHAALNKSSGDDLIFIGGSTFIVADLLKSI